MRNRVNGDTYRGRKKIDGTWVYDVPKPPKIQKPACRCSPQNKSRRCRAFTENDREAIFMTFWRNLKTWREKRVWIATLVLQSRPDDLRHRQVALKSRRSVTFRYHLKTKAKILPVCKTMFLNTVGVTQKLVYRAVSILDSSKPQRQRKAVLAPDSILVRKRSSANTFLSKLTKMESHYCRASSSKEYLEPMWDSMDHLYREYVNCCAEEGHPVASKTSFVQMFNDMNLGLFSPRKDQCDLCCEYKQGAIDKAIYEQHIIDKNCARDEKVADTKAKKHVFTMDTQRVLLAPYIQASLAYYKMKLVVHNFSLFDNITKGGFCYLWHEGEGGVTGNEFASLLCKFIADKETAPGDELIFFSDGCTAQNRNIFMANALSNMAIQHQITIIQKFLENFTYFKDFDSVPFRSSIRPGKSKGDPKVTDLRCLQYLPTGEIHYKIHYTDDWKILQQKRNQHIRSMPFNDLPRLHDDSCRITKKKIR